MRWSAPCSFNRPGEILDHSFEQQRSRASGINLVTAAVVLWNTVYLERAAYALRGNGHAVDGALLQDLAGANSDMSHGANFSLTHFGCQVLQCLCGLSVNLHGSTKCRHGYQKWLNSASAPTGRRLKEFEESDFHAFH
jgi:hypothetical protein